MAFNKLVQKAVKAGLAQAKAQADAAAQNKSINDALASAKYRRLDEEDVAKTGLKKGGYVKAADGCAKKGKTKGRMV